MKKLIRVYTFFGKTMLSVVIILVMLNLLALIPLKWQQHDEQEDLLYELINYEAYTTSGLDSSYVNNFLAEAIAFLKSDKDEFIYHPATEFQHAVFQTEAITINGYAHDFNRRPTNYDVPQDSCKNTKAIYCFGGSTTLGSFVRDFDTWPAMLSSSLSNQSKDKCLIIKNYGVAGFVPTQETNQFIHLLKMGHRPSLAIFMDGYNIGPEYDGSDFSGIIFNKFKLDEEKVLSITHLIAQLPIIKLLRGEAYYKEIDFSKSDGYDIADLGNTNEWNEEIANRFIQNAELRKVVADLYQVEIIQILQPNSYVAYNPSLFSPLVSTWMLSEDSKQITSNYQWIYQEIKDRTDLFIDFSQLLTTYSEPAIVDLIHYSPGFNQFLSEQIASEINIDSLANFLLIDSLATGRSFDYQ